jgi:DNA-binding transcriptional ArsR family regulator
MIARLVQGECSVGELGEAFTISSPAITKHLDVLEDSGLIIRRKAGRVRYCRLQENGLRDAGDWIVQQRAFWEQQFDALGKYLEGKSK